MLILLRARLNTLCILSIILPVLMLATSSAVLAASSIGGKIWTGAQLADGSPQLVGNSQIINDDTKQVKVMVQNLDTGEFVAYGNVDPGTNNWSASVPAPGGYLVMFMADGHDSTSREYHVLADGIEVRQDAYLPPAPVPTANLLVYAFKDHYVNTEDDYPMDYALKGVKFTVKNEKGVVVAEGISGSQILTDMPEGAGPDLNGLYYFTGLEPGSYEVTADIQGPVQISDPTIGKLVSTNSDWYQISSMEGTNVEEVTLYPGDPGTVAGGYWTWFAFAENQEGAGTGSGSISGRLYDADGPWFPDEPFTPPASQIDFVTPNLYVPNGLLVLYPNTQTASVVKPIATTEADRKTGEYTFKNVPPGNYRIFATDIPLDYIWQEIQATVTPGAAVAGVDLYLPRWFARVRGTVTDVDTQDPVPGARVTLRIEDGSIWKETITDEMGEYLFDELPEVEVLGVVSVEPPAGYRAVLDLGDHNYDLSSRTVQWYSANYKADLQLEKISTTEGVIRGFVHNDNWELNEFGVWQTDGQYDEHEEKTFSGITVELFNSDGTPVLDESGLVVTATTGGIDEAAILQQGWIPPYTIPPDEFGGVFYGTTIGQYEFRGVSPGNYQVRVKMPNGFRAIELEGYKSVTLAGSEAARVDLGIKTEVQLAGEIEGGIFDDINLDTNPESVWFDEKAVVVGAPLGVYDHLGYFLGSAYMGSPLCYEGSPVCPSKVTPHTFCTPGYDCPIEKPEVGIRVAPGPHIFVGNDPAFHDNGYDPSFEPLPWAYNFGQGKNKFEADWSLIPTAMAINDGGAMIGGPLGNDLIKPQNQPVIISITDISPPVVLPIAQSSYFDMLAFNESGLGTMTDVGGIRIASARSSGRVKVQDVILSIDGNNFGDTQGFSTVTLSGVKLHTESWSDTHIVVSIPADSIKGALVVMTSTGMSNAMYPDLSYSRKMSKYMSRRSVFVDAGSANSGDGSETSPYKTISEALAHLPSGHDYRYVFVKAGTYNERLRIRESHVKLIGDGAHETIINGGGPLTISPTGISSGGPVVFIGLGGESGAVSNITISGFTIKGGSSGDDSGGGIFGDYGNTNLNINTSIITENMGEYGGGIWLHKSNHDVQIWSNVIGANGSIGGYGGGISVNDEPEYGPSIPYGANEHLLDDAKRHPRTEYNIYNNLVIYNVSQDYGGGMSLYEVKDHLNITGNVIMENKSYDHGGGIFFEDCGPVDLSSNVFIHNFAADDGGAVSFEDVGDKSSRVKVYGNIFAENIADDVGENTARGGAIAFDDTLKAEVFNNTIVGNIVAGTNNPRGGAIDSERHGHEYMNLEPAFSDVKIYNNIIWNNKRLDYEQIYRRGKESEGQDYQMGEKYIWTQDNLHVDNPAVQEEWASQNNSESFSEVENNDISDGSYTNRNGNVNADPAFVNPESYDFHLMPSSPLVKFVPEKSSHSEKHSKKHSEKHSEKHSKKHSEKQQQMGAYGLSHLQPSIVMIPDIPNIIVVPKQ